METLFIALAICGENYRITVRPLAQEASDEAFVNLLVWTNNRVGGDLRCPLGYVHVASL